jgi:hypothetical protein
VAERRLVGRRRIRLVLVSTMLLVGAAFVIVALVVRHAEHGSPQYRRGYAAGTQLAKSAPAPTSQRQQRTVCKRAEHGSGEHGLNATGWLQGCRDGYRAIR